MSRQSYLPLPIVRAFGPSFPAWPICCSAFRPWSASLALPTALPTTPSADSCAVIRRPPGSLSSEIGTRRRSPQVSSIAFPAPLPDLQPWSLMDMDFAIRCPLVRRLPLLSGFCPSAPPFCLRFLSTPPRGGFPFAPLTPHLPSAGEEN